LDFILPWQKTLSMPRTLDAEVEGAAFKAARKTFNKTG